MIFSRIPFRATNVLYKPNCSQTLRAVEWFNLIPSYALQTADNFW